MNTCRFGDNCYRKNFDHIKQFHPEKLQSSSSGDEKQVPGPAVERRRNHEESFSLNTKRLKRAYQYLPTRDEATKKFYAHAVMLNKDDPLHAFSSLNGLTLIGTFECLNSSHSQDAKFDVQYPHDLPEMESIAKCNKGHYAFWRDEPKLDYLIVHSSDAEHFPEITVVGNRLEHMLCHAAGKDTSALKKLLPNNQTLENLTKAMKAVVAKRKKEKVGELVGVGIWVPVRNNVGYREMAESPDKIKKIITALCTSSDEQVRRRNEDKLGEVINYIQFANDESDFGTGLELGHLLWMANYSQLNGYTERVLGLAYRLLGRDYYSDIVSERMS